MFQVSFQGSRAQVVLQNRQPTAHRARQCSVARTMEVANQSCLKLLAPRAFIRPGLDEACNILARTCSVLAWVLLRCRECELTPASSGTNVIIIHSQVPPSLVSSL